MALAFEEYPDKVLGPEAIFRLWQLRSRDQVFVRRNAWYDVAEEYYYGSTEARKAGNSVYAMNSVGMPVLRDMGGGLEMSRRYVANLIAPIVDDNQALLGQCPAPRSLPPEPTEAGDKKAEQITKYLISGWDLSDMDEQHPEAVLYTSMLGDACLTVSPFVDTAHPKDPRHHRPLVSSVHPRNCYPSFYSSPGRRFDVYDLIIACRYPVGQIKRDYGVAVQASNQDANVVITYLSPYQRTVVIGKIPTGEHVEWDLNLCPAVWIFNKQAGGKYGQADINHALPLQDYYDASLNVAFDGAWEATYAITQVVNPDGISSQGIPIGPGAVLETDETTEIRRIAPNPNPTTAINLADLASRDLMKTAGTTSVRQEGDMHSSIVTGRAIHNAQGPQATRTDLKIKRISRRLEKLNEAMLAVQELAPYLSSDPIMLYGSHQGKDFVEQFHPKDDIDGWYRNTVSFEKLIGQNLQQKTVTAMQLVAAKLASRTTAMEMVGVEDPVGEMKKIQQDRVDEAKHEAEIQGILQGGQAEGGMQQKVPGAPGVSFSGGGGGGFGPQAPPMMRPRALMGGAPMAGGVPKGATIEAIRGELVKVADQLKGQVFAVGELAREGMSDKPDVRNTAWEDYRVIKPLIQGLAPGANVKQTSADKIPDLAVLII